MKPLVLVILDGWGVREEKEGNAVYHANTPNFDGIKNECPYSELEAAGEAVGLLEGYQGNSEVGHLTIGSGRINFQSMVKINKAIEDKSFFDNPAIVAAIDNCKKNDSNLHLFGLVQDQGVHALTSHAVAVLRCCKEHDFDRVYVHAFTDGRDTAPKSAKIHLNELEEGCKRYTARIVSVCGRYYAMDRDKRWDRTKKAYDMLINKKGERCKNYHEALELSYSKGESDEFITPKILDGFVPVEDKDSIIFFNYRLDRARQLTHAFLDPDFSHFNREKKDVFYVPFTEYYDELKYTEYVKIAFDEDKKKNLLGEVLAKNGVNQLRVAETEKYAHVTFFFNGKREEPFYLEDRALLDSPKVATYDLKPEMSAHEVKEKVIEKIDHEEHKMIIVNFANPDMVGHTGDFKACVRGIEAVDSCLGEILKAVTDKEGVALVTSDHGNAEEMCGDSITAHTLNKVPFIVVGNDCSLRGDGGLSDIAPTILGILGIDKPDEMTGKSLTL